MSLAINGLAVTTMKVRIPWSGVWTAELELAPSAEVLPRGRVTIVSTEGDAMTCTTDPERTFEFSDRKYVRVIGGAAGWSKNVRAQHFHSEAGVRMQELASATAAEVLESVIVLDPTALVGVDFARSNAEASQIFVDAGVDWWVGFDGVARVGIRPSVAPPLSLEILGWSPETSTITFNCDVLVEPGTILVDPRFGTRVVREVDALFDKGAVSGTLVVAETSAAAGSVGELYDAIAAISRVTTRCEAGRLYEYRVIATLGDRVELQSLDKAMPDLSPVSIRPGASGIKFELRLSSLVLVGFVGGDPRHPFVAFYEGVEGEWRPTKLMLDALESITLGDEATAKPIARAFAIQAFADAMVTAFDGIAAAEALKAGPATHPDLGATFKALTESLRAAAQTMSTDMPSAKVKAS